MKEKLNFLRRSRWYKTILVFGLLFIVSPVMSQENESPSGEMQPTNRKQKKAEKKKAKQKAKNQSIIEEGLQRHQDIQTKAVRKRMKRSLKEANRHNHNKRKPFFRRLFGNVEEKNNFQIYFADKYKT